MASAAVNEAFGLFDLLKRGETVQGLRQLIGAATPERRATLRAFEALCYQHGLLRITPRPTQQHEARRLRRRNTPVRDVARRGKRFEQTKREAIENAIRAGLRPTEICRQFAMAENSLLKFRRRMGMYRDCRFKLVSKKVRAEVLRLLPTRSMASIAKSLGLTLGRVRWVAGSVGALKTSGSGYPINDELKAQIATSLQAGMAPIDVVLQFKVNIATINRSRRTLGVWRDLRRAYKVSSEQVQAIRGALANKSKTQQALAQEFGVSRATIGNILLCKKRFA